MSSVWAIARKEFRGFFSSPVAFIFLAVTLGVTLVYFFPVAKFFANNTADCRALFGAMPWVLILLVSALTMKLWSEEQKSGTLEVLMTLPVSHRDMVLGKFFAGLALIAMALAFTIGVPVTVDSLGPLDWGPVMGGYFAALLLGGAYLALGLCVSSLTDNQIVSLILTLVVGLVFVVVGQESISNYVGTQIGELIGGIWEDRGDSAGQAVTAVMESLGTTSRFRNIQRGLLDSRDIAFFLSLTVFFLFLNMQMILAKRQLPPESKEESNRSTFVMLLAVNFILMNMWMAPSALFRLDLTEDKLYSLSPLTHDVVSGLDEELFLGIYTSLETAEVIKPLIPELRDFAREYAEVGGGRIRLEIKDPVKDDELAAMLEKRFQIRSEPMPVYKKNSDSVVQAYFHILVRYGDRHAVLGLRDLIQVPLQMDPVTEQPIVRFNNLEYDLTRSIQKTAYEFQSLEGAFARLNGEARVRMWYTRESFAKLDEELAKTLDTIVTNVAESANELAKKSGGKLSFTQSDPRAEGMDLRMLANEGIPFQQLMSGQIFALQLEVDGSRELIPISEELDVTDIRRRLEEALRRHLPGFTKTVGLWTGDPPAQPDPRGMGPPRQQTSYGLVEQALEQNYTVRNINAEIDSGRVPSDVDVLLVMGLGEELTEGARWAFDQFAMSGKPVIICQGDADVGLQPQRLDVAFKPRTNGLNDVLENYGIQVYYRIVQSDECGSSFTGDQRRPEIRDRDPSILDVRGEGIEAHPATAGLSMLMMPWTSPVRFDNRRKDARYTTLLRTGSDTWLHTAQAVQDQHGSGAFEGVQVLAGIVQGHADSFYADKPAPALANGMIVTADRAMARLNAIDDICLAVIGNHATFQDLSGQLMGAIDNYRPGHSDAWKGNFTLLQNLVSWGLEDDSLSALRGRGHNARLLRRLDEGEPDTIELLNYGVAVVLLGLVLAGLYFLRLTRTPLVQVSGGSEA